MTGWIAALCGLAGAVCVELAELYSYTRKPGWNWREPIPNVRRGAYLLSVALRAAMGTILAAVFAGQVSGPVPAFAFGIAAPLVIEKLSRKFPLTKGADSGDA